MSSQVQWLLLLHCADKMAYMYGSDSPWLVKQTCLQTNSQLLVFCLVLFYRPGSSALGMKVCLFTVFVYVWFFFIFRKLFVGFECCLSCAFFGSFVFSFLSSSQHVNHIAY